MRNLEPALVVRALVIKPNDLSLIPGISTVAGENHLPQSCPLTSTHVLGHLALPSTQKKKCDFKIVLSQRCKKTFLPVPG